MTQHNVDLTELISQAVETVLWSNGEESDAEGHAIQAWDSVYDSDDISEHSRVKIAAKVVSFAANNWDDFMHYLDAGRSVTDFAHDYVLTSAGHGVGFWDRGLGDLGDRLSESARPEGSLYVYHGSECILGCGAGKFCVEEG